MMQFQRRQPPILSIPSVVFSGNLLKALKRAGLLVMRQGCRVADLEMDRVTAYSILEVTTTGRNSRQSSAWWSSPASFWRVLVATLPRWSARPLSTHHLS